MKTAETIIGPMSGMAFELKTNDIIMITDIAGGQPGDLVALNLHNYNCRFGQARTRIENGRYAIGAGDKLWTAGNPPLEMLEILPDSDGLHSLMYAPCCRYALEKRFNTSSDGCFEHLCEALAPYGIGADNLPEPMSLFFNAVTGENCSLGIGNHASQPNDTVSLRALMDCLVAITTCSVPIPGRDNSGYKINIIKPDLS